MKSEGIAEIPSGKLRDCGQELAPPIAHIINLSVKSAHTSEALKAAIVTPV